MPNPITIDWSALITMCISLGGAVALWLRSKTTEKKVDGARAAAENGHELRAKLIAENDELRQKVAALVLSNEELGAIVRYIRSRPEPPIQQALAAYRDKRQVRTYDSASESPFAPLPAPLSVLPPWVRWLAGLIGMMFLGYAWWTRRQG